MSDGGDGVFVNGLREIVGDEVRKVVAALREGIRTDLRAEFEAERRMQPPERLDVARAAKRLGVSIATVRRRIKDGSLPVFRVGRRVLVEVSAVRRSNDIAEASRLAARDGRRGLAAVPGLAPGP